MLQLFPMGKPFGVLRMRAEGEEEEGTVAHWLGVLKYPITFMRGPNNMDLIQTLMVSGPGETGRAMQSPRLTLYPWAGFLNPGFLLISQSGSFLVLGAALCIVGWWTVSLASPTQTEVASHSTGDSQRYL